MLRFENVGDEFFSGFSTFTKFCCLAAVGTDHSGNSKKTNRTIGRIKTKTNVYNRTNRTR